MPTERLSMRHIREILRLHHSVGMSQRAVARSFNLAQGHGLGHERSSTAVGRQVALCTYVGLRLFRSGSMIARALSLR